MVNGTPEVVFPNPQGNDALATIRIYLHQHLPESRTGFVEEYLEGLQGNILTNRKTDSDCRSLLLGLSQRDRRRAEALIADIGVLLTQRRNQLLRDAYTGSLTGSDLDRLFQVLWLKYSEESRRIKTTLRQGPWPSLPSHPDVPEVIGPLTGRMYDQHAAEAEAVAELIMSIHGRSEREGLVGAQST